MSNDFNRYVTNPVSLDISRSMFNDPVKVLMSGNVGMVYPIMCKEILPGDSIKCTTAKVVRVQPLVTPIFDNLWLDTYWFFVPNRLVWNHWKEFLGENTQTAWVPSVSYTVPQITIPSGGFNVGSLADHLGIPPTQAAGRTVSALPFRGYALIMNEFFRDQNLMNPVHVHVDDTTRTGVNTTDQVTDVELGGAVFNACKLHDLFTSALPGAQKASGPQVQFALNGLLPVNAYSGKSTFSTNQDWIDKGIGPVLYNTFNSNTTWAALAADTYVGADANGTHSATSTGTTGTRMSPNNLFADLDNTSIFDINSLRQAFAIQRFYEKQARGGSRMNEQIRSFFGVTVPDYRIQRPEYLGGNRIPIQISQVEQTSATQSGLTPQGNLTGISHTGDVHNDFVSSFYEHGYLFGLVVMRYEHTYQQGIEEHWTRKTLFDFYNPTFANLGEQILSEDLIYFDTNTNPGVFGYQEAWATYRNTPNAVHGQMRSQATTPLDMWHLADNYSSMPYLSDSWIREDKSNLDRCLAVTSSIADQFMADFEIRLEEARPMPLYSVPGLIDHH